MVTPPLGVVTKAGRSVHIHPLFPLYTQSFVDYVLAKGTISRPARGDYSNQVVITKDGVTLP